MNDILELAKQLSKQRELVNSLEEQVKEAKTIKDDIQFKLIEKLQESGLKSIKTNEANYSLTTKSDIKVTDENSVMEALKVNGVYDDYVHPKLDTLMFKNYAKSVLNNTGEVITGTELTETTYISIKSAIQTA